MSKKINSKARFIVTLVFALILCLSLAMPAFATGDTDPLKVSKAVDEDHQAQAAITKILKMPIGTETPEKTFTFTFVKNGLPNEPKEGLEPSYMPGIDPVEIKFKATDTGKEVSGYKEVRLQSIDFIADSNLNTVTWTRAGVYQYILEEVDEEALNTTYPDTYIYSKAKYEVNVYVANGDNKLYVSHVEVIILALDESNDENDDVGSKADPTPGTNVGNGGHSKVVFTNYYLKKNGGTTVNETNTVLGISKKVDGLTADQTKYFTFTVSVEKPVTDKTDNVVYKGYIMEGNTVITPTAATNAPSPAKITGNYIEFPSGAAVIIKLKHNQKLAFMDVPVGAVFNAKEAAEPLYVPNYHLYSQENDITNDEDGLESKISDKNYELAIPLNQHVGDITATEKKDGAAFLNDTDEASPTGLNTNTLPFIVLIVVVAAAIAGFVVFRYRRNVRYDA